MSTIAERLRSPKEKALHLTALVVGTLLWMLIAFWAWSALHNPDPRIAGVTGLYVFYAVAIGLFVFLSSVFYRAAAYGNMILLGPDQFPHLHEMVVAGSSALGLSSPPKTFLYNSNGLFNAFARRIWAVNSSSSLQPWWRPRPTPRSSSSSVTSWVTTPPATSTPG